MNKEEVFEIIKDSVGKKPLSPVARPDYEKWLKRQLDTDPIKIITGFRRVGKSFLLKQIYWYLIEKKNIPSKSIFFVNFEHTLLQEDLNTRALYKMYELFLEESEPDKEQFLFLDEIQNVNGWERFVRTIYEKDPKRCNIFITGSNSSLLSSELSSSLGGRFLTLSIHPFSFKEFLRYHEIEISDVRSYVQNQNKVEHLLDKYLRYGGLPEAIPLAKEDKENYIKNVFRKVLLDDIVKRFKVKNIETLELLFYLLLSNTGSITSLSSIQKQLSSNISVPSLNSYTDYYKAAFALSSIHRFSWKTKEVFKRLQKYYPVDQSFITFLSVNHDNLESRRLESVVFTHLQKMHPDKIFYGRDPQRGREIDFIVKHDDSFKKIQVALELNNKNKRRELGNFTMPREYINGPNLLITRRTDATDHKVRGVKIKEIPLWQFLLGI